MPVGVAARALLGAVGDTVDSFEDGDTSEYSAGTFGGTADFTVVSNSGYETDGSEALRGDTTDGFHKEIISTSGLSRYPDDDTDRYKVDVTPGDSGTCQPKVSYRVQDADNMWRVVLEGGNDTLALEKRTSGSTSSFTNTTAALSAGSTYTVTIDPTGGDADDFTATVTDDNSTDQTVTSDTALSGETGIGFAYKNVNGSGQEAFFDNARLD